MLKALVRRVPEMIMMRAVGVDLCELAVPERGGVAITPKKQTAPPREEWSGCWSTTLVDEADRKGLKPHYPKQQKACGCPPGGTVHLR